MYGLLQQENCMNMKNQDKVVRAEFARGIIDDGCDEIDAKESLM